MHFQQLYLFIQFIFSRVLNHSREMLYDPDSEPGFFQLSLDRKYVPQQAGNCINKLISGLDGIQDLNNFVNLMNARFDLFY